MSAAAINDLDTLQTAVDEWLQNETAASEKYGDISTWDVSSVTSMDNLFNGRRDFNGDISKWNVGKVTSMVRMFRSASSFNGDVSKWNVGKVTTMQGMFYVRSTRALPPRS